MRILAIGLGGAGCKIVDKLYFADRRNKNSRIKCVEAIAVDVEQKTIKNLKYLPENCRLFFASLDPVRQADNGTLIDVDEVVAKVQALEHGETDAIFICCGLGGTLVDVAPQIISALRKSTVEPIFGLITLPCLAEGQKKSAKAADDIEKLQPLLDGIILFDNETWYHKIKIKLTTMAQKKPFLLGFRKRPKTEEEETREIYEQLNDAVIRRVVLILRAGEFSVGGKIDLAEVVLDSGEVVNTMKGMGFITIGYAVEHLPTNPLNFFSKFHATAGLFSDDHYKKDSRIVDLAKDAIYHEISTPCDITSAQKALILIAGPSHELSMKGFMVVRKWIDRSIAGLEMRSGDYPVAHTSIVAIIIMLSGLHNIPRLEELKEIREEYLRDVCRKEIQSPEPDMQLKDTMITLPSNLRGTAREAGTFPDIGEISVISGTAQEWEEEADTGRDRGPEEKEPFREMVPPKIEAAPEAVPAMAAASDSGGNRSTDEVIPTAERFPEPETPAIAETRAEEAAPEERLGATKVARPLQTTGAEKLSEPDAHSMIPLPDTTPAFKGGAVTPPSALLPHSDETARGKRAVETPSKRHLLISDVIPAESPRPKVSLLPGTEAKRTDGAEQQDLKKHHVVAVSHRHTLHAEQRPAPGEVPRTDLRQTGRKEVQAGDAGSTMLQGDLSAKERGSHQALTPPAQKRDLLKKNGAERLQIGGQLQSKRSLSSVDQIGSRDALIKRPSIHISGKTGTSSPAIISTPHEGKDEARDLQKEERRLPLSSPAVRSPDTTPPQRLNGMQKRIQMKGDRPPMHRPASQTGSGTMKGVVTSRPLPEKMPGNTGAIHPDHQAGEAPGPRKIKKNDDGNKEGTSV